jgi:hypothetical protein
MNNLAPIVLFVYNRPWHTRQTVEALQKNKLASESELFIYCDNAKSGDSQGLVNEVRGFVNNIDGFKKITIIKRKRNYGLANSIIDGVTKIVNKYGKVIVLEDDLVTSPYFLEFMNDGLEMYEDELKVASIHGYIYPIDNLPDIFFIKGADCWGWATWKRAWDEFEPNGKKLLNELKSKKLEKEADFNNSFRFTQMLKDQIKGKNNSWAIRWYMSTFLKDMVTLYPGKSYVENIGFDSSGAHCEDSDVFEVKLGTITTTKIEILENLESRKKIEVFFNSLKISLAGRIVSKLKRITSAW